jgi:hypothetical protein
MHIDDHFRESFPDQFADHEVSSIGTPATGTSALGKVSVSGARRVPRPAAKIIAFIPATFDFLK